jgi:hypothetical protein
MEFPGRSHKCIQVRVPGPQRDVVSGAWLAKIEESDGWPS